MLVININLNLSAQKVMRKIERECMKNKKNATSIQQIETIYTLQILQIRLLLGMYVLPVVQKYVGTNFRLCKNSIV